MKNLALKVAGVIFLVVAMMHLVRVVYKIQIVAGGIDIPIAVSIGGFLFALILAFWMFIASGKK